MSNNEAPRIPDTADELVSKIDEAQPIGDAIEKADVGLIDSARRGSEQIAELAQEKHPSEPDQTLQLPGLLQEQHDEKLSDSQTPKAA